MSEPVTTSPPEFGATDETDDAAGLYVVEVPDEARDAMLASVRVIDDGAASEDKNTPHFANWDEIEQVSEITRDGVWVDLGAPMPKGTQILLGDTDEFVREQSRLERIFRLKHPKYGKPKKGGELPDLPSETATDIMIAASFGTIVRNWRGPGFARANGDPVEFNAETYKKACRTQYVGVEIFNKMGGGSSKALEIIRKNS